MVYGLYEVSDAGLQELGSKRVIYEDENHLLSCLVGSTPYYIGKTIQKPGLRMSVHASQDNACPGVKEWHQKLKETRGKNAKDVLIAMVILESNIPGDKITDREGFFVKKFDTLHPNGANMHVPGHHGDYVASEILIAKRHLASYTKIEKQFGDAETLVKNLLQMGKKVAQEYYNAGFGDFDNWLRILSNKYKS